MRCNIDFEDDDDNDDVKPTNQRNTDATQFLRNHVSFIVMLELEYTQH